MVRSSSGLPHSLDKLFADQPETIQLPNGLTVTFQQVPAQPVVSVQAWIKTGSIHEDQHLGSGMSHFLEHMLFKGTRKRKPGEIAAEVQRFGGQINAYTAFDRTVYYIDGPSEALGQTLELLADLTLNAALPLEELEKEREVILREIDMTLDDPDRLVSRALFSTAYKVHPFRYPVIGHKELFERVNREVLLDYYKSRYQPENMVLSIAGHFDREELLREIDQTFGAASRHVVKPVSVQQEPNQLAFRETRLFGDYNTARGLLAFKLPSMRHPDSPALDIMTTIIGSGHSGRLRQRLREELQLVYGISATTWNPGLPGLLWINYHCSAEKAKAAEQAILDTCHAFANNGFTEDELEKALRFASVSEIHTRQTASGLASRLGLVTAIVGDPNYPLKYFQRIHELTASDLSEVAGRYFKEDSLTVSSLLPESCKIVARESKLSSETNPFQEKMLANGARLIWQKDDRLPRTWMRFAALGGALYEEPKTRGSTSLLSTMLTRDTEFQTAAEVAEALESSGGFMVEASGNNTFSIGIEVMPDAIDQGVRALNDALLHPAFSEDTLAREMEAQVAHIQELQDEVLDFGRLELRKKFYGDHPFATIPYGTEDSIAQIDAACLKNLYKSLMCGSNAVLVISGDFDPDEDLPKLEKLLLRLPDQDFEKKDVPFTGPASTGCHRVKMDREQAVVFEAYPDTGLKPENEVVGSVLDELLSDMSGPLFRAVREEQSLAYYVGASRLLGIQFGTFYLYAGTHPSSVDDVFACFDQELQRIREGDVNEEELQAAITRLKVHNRFSLQSPAGRVNRVALNAIYEKPIMDWLSYEERLNAVTLQDIVDFATTYLSKDKQLRLVVSPN
ncbi:MAG: M16 family metallopeptidase [Puniceicoccaceae bacterium]